MKNAEEKKGKDVKIAKEVDKKSIPKSKAKPKLKATQNKNKLMNTSNKKSSNKSNILIIDYFT